MKTNGRNALPSTKESRREAMIAIAREMRSEFAKLHNHMEQILARANFKKAA